MGGEHVSGDEHINQLAVREGLRTNFVGVKDERRVHFVEGVAERVEVERRDLGDLDGHSVGLGRD